MHVDFLLLVRSMHGITTWQRVWWHTMCDHTVLLLLLLRSRSTCVRGVGITCAYFLGSRDIVQSSGGSSSVVTNLILA